jgi:hypothetical protein
LQIGRLDLEERFGPGQTLELIQAKISEADAGGLMAVNRVAGCA